MSLHEHEHHPMGHNDPPARHGMTVLGTDRIFLSHLPMFMPVHDFQVILQVEFVGVDGLPSENYFNDRRAHPDQQLYTLNPEPFVITELLGPNPTRSTFRAKVFRNHFERDETDPQVIDQDVVVKVKKVVHGRKFDKNAEPLPHLQYILFGGQNELFLAHLITRPPDFDQLLHVRVDRDLSNDDVAQAPLVSMVDRTNTSDKRVGPGVNAVASLHVDSETLAIRVEPVVEVYLEERELQG